MRIVKFSVEYRGMIWHDELKVSSAINSEEEIQQVIADQNEGKGDGKRVLISIDDIEIDYSEFSWDELQKDERKRLSGKVKRAINLKSSGHIWTKKNLVSLTDGSDILECAKCGVTGKRYAFSEMIYASGKLGNVEYCNKFRGK